MKEYFATATKRLSVRKYSDVKLTEAQLLSVKNTLNNLVPLVDDIAVQFEIVPCSQTNCKFNAEYCLVCYSEDKPRYRENIGYMLEQWDLALQSQGIGVCWYGWGRTNAEKQGKAFVIMLCFGNCDPGVFRTNISQFNRKQPRYIWKGDYNREVAKISGFAPSACNSQPWRVTQNGNEICVYQKKGGASALITRLSKHFNRVDMGIFLCFLEMALENSGYTFDREVCAEMPDATELIAKYTLQN